MHFFLKSHLYKYQVLKISFILLIATIHCHHSIAHLDHLFENGIESICDTYHLSHLNIIFDILGMRYLITICLRYLIYYLYFSSNSFIMRLYLN